jgi:hypothetical protein
MPALAGGNQTFPYDGGPSVPPPMPDMGGADTAAPAAAPYTAKSYTLPRETTGGTTQYTTQFIGLGINSTTTQQRAVDSGSRYNYPAYGETPLPDVRGKAR